MPALTHNAVRLLEPGLINQIAAGEVVERPASVVKELVENALDAGATHIKIILRDGGQSLISITDNGRGMNPVDLELAVERHATSKIPDGNLFQIATLGFRGEALPSIGAVARLHLTSRGKGEPDAWCLKVEGGVKHPLAPAALSVGTKIEVYDLFFATPARLKFLKSPQTEMAYAQEVLQRLAIAHPHVAFELWEGARKIFHYESAEKGPREEILLPRLKAILGQEFQNNALPVQAQRDGYFLTGFAALPTFHRANAQHQYFFVNGRPVKDKLLTALARAAYHDFLPKERYPAVVLFLDIPPEDLDVNVHPAKIEVRFRDQGLVRGLLLGALKSTLHEAGHRASSTLSQGALAAFRPPPGPVVPLKPSAPAFRDMKYTPPAFGPASSAPFYLEEANVLFLKEPLKKVSLTPEPLAHLEERPLGEALGQIHHSYIVAQTTTGLILVDQHAVHERLIYEQMKKNLEEEGPILRQALLIPEVIEISRVRRDLFQKHIEGFAQLGLVLELFGESALLVREIPHLLDIEEIKTVLMDLADNLEALENKGSSFDVIRDLFDTLFASLACRGSLKAGKRLTKEEMNALLRQMEETPFSGQCNHGRPTYVELHLRDIEKLFGRR